MDGNGGITVKIAYVVGIAGGSASGKSTFSEQLKQGLAGLTVSVLSMDAYYRDSEERPRTAAPITGIVYKDDNHPDAFDLEKMTADLKNTAADGNTDVVLAEGLFTLWHPPLFELLDLKLFIDCRADERIVRRLKRNRQWGLEFDEIAAVYLDLGRYRHDEFVEPSRWKADFILNGSRPSVQALEMLTRHIQMEADKLNKERD